MAEHDSNEERNSMRSRGCDLLWVLVAVVPLLSVYYYHFRSPKGPTGFVQTDMPQYTAEGREIFERGNGFSYPNPYDDDPAAPAIYFHWLIWLFGLGVAKFGLDPGHLFMSVGVAGAVAFGWVTLRLVDAVLESRRFRVPLFLVAMWGGGLVCAANIAVNVREGKWWREELMAFDTGWADNWGRNVFSATELVYHVLAGWCWLSVFRRRWWTAIFANLLLATTHPFSGLQLSGTLAVWWTVQAIRHRTAPWIRQWLATGAIGVGFLAYNLVFLNLFPQHRAIQEILTLPHLLTNTEIVLAYGVVALVAASRILCDWNRLTFKDGFLVAMFAVSFLLSIHDRFLPIKPIEPKHFTRGYIWMPLFLLGLPLVQRSLVGLDSRIRRLASPRPLAVRACAAAGFHALVWPLFMFAVFDNFCFNFLLFDIERARFVHQGCYLTKEARQALDWINARGLDGELLCAGDGTEWYRPHRMTSYLAASYTSMRPYIGHHFMTPHIFERVEQVQAWVEGRGEHPWFDRIDYVLAEKGGDFPLLKRDEWTAVYANDRIELLKRTGRDEPDSEFAVAGPPEVADERR